MKFLANASHWSFGFEFNNKSIKSTSLSTYIGTLEEYRPIHNLLKHVEFMLCFLRFLRSAVWLVLLIFLLLVLCHALN